MNYIHLHFFFFCFFSLSLHSSVSRSFASIGNIVGRLCVCVAQIKIEFKNQSSGGRRVPGLLARRIRHKIHISNFGVYEMDSPQRLLRCQCTCSPRTVNYQHLICSHNTHIAVTHTHVHMAAIEIKCAVKIIYFRVSSRCVCMRTGELAQRRMVGETRETCSNEIRIKFTQNTPETDG